MILLWVCAAVGLGVFTPLFLFSAFAAVILGVATGIAAVECGLKKTGVAVGGNDPPPLADMIKFEGGLLVLVALSGSIAWSCHEYLRLYYW